MLSGLLPGLFALLGAAIGGAVKWGAVRNRRSMAAVTRAQAVLDRRYAAHTDFVVAVDRFRKRAREYRSLLYDGAPAEQADAAGLSYIEACDVLSDKVGVAGMSGPPELADSAASVHRAAEAYAETIDQWRRSGSPAEGRGARERKCLAGLAELDDARGRYIVLASLLFSE
ncbi:MAG: hypothetical protein HOQ24_08840 [Mycobacteriaceae bacterium]|nr:hypothetical protein [Mycobacteriaceae bacterium]